MNLSITPPYNLIIVVFLISVSVLYFSFKNAMAFRENFIIIIFRAFILLSLIILLLNPTLKYKASENYSLPWHVYVDNSLSIKYHKQPSLVSYKNGIKNFLNKVKEKGISYETFSFGSVLDTLEDISDLKLDANSTNLGLVFEKINNDYQKNLAGAIIFTDGQINQGLPIQQFYNNNIVPIHIVGIGETTPMQDVSIKSVDIPPLCVKGDDVNIDVIITSLGVIDDRVNITLFDDNNKLIGSKIISISGNQENEVVRFQISPNKIGENKFLVKCSALPEEINIKNNQEKITLQVMKDEYNIALVTGAPNYNTKVLKSYLLKKGNILVDHYVINSENFNQKIKQFLEKKYEVIIFDNNPVSSSSKKWNSIARVFAKKLLSHNSSFFIVPGPEIEFKSLNRYLKIIDLEAKQLLLNNVQDNKKWEFLNTWYSLSSINKNINFSSYSYPPQTPLFQLTNNFDNKTKQIYAKYIDSDITNPLLVLGEKQLIRYAVWNSINISSLKYMLVDSDLDFLFEYSLRKIINWLMKKNDNSEFVFRTDKNSYQHGESVFLTGVSSNISDGLKIKDGIVELYNNNQYIDSKPLFFDLNKNIYKANFWAPKPGKIDYIVKINKKLETYVVSRGAFKVQESHIELNRIFLNETKLKNMSLSSNGSFNLWQNNEDLINKLENIYKPNSYIAAITFRYNYFYLCFIILLLSLEWYYRKKIGFN